VPIANDIVSMRAQYGRDTTAVMDGVVDTYDQTTPTTGCGWIKTSALRLVLVARNGQPEKTAVTAAAPTWAGGTINLTATNSTVPAGFTWQNFRYKVFQTAIPLRNITSMGAVAGC
jgi:type IV pilus assembly protein PilW